MNINPVNLFQSVLTPAKLREAWAIYKDTPIHQRNDKLSALLSPAMSQIDASTGQENSLQYMAYLLEHTFNTVGEF